MSFTKFKVGDEVVFKDESSCCWLVLIKELKNYGSLQYKIEFLNTGSDNRWVSENQIEIKNKGGKVMQDESKKSSGDATTNGRALYEVIAVNPTEDGDILLTEKVVANGHDDAKFSSSLKEVLKSKGLRRGDVDVIVNYLGAVRPYETEQKVKIVGSVDGFSLIKKEK